MIIIVWKLYLLLHWYNRYISRACEKRCTLILSLACMMRTNIVLQRCQPTRYIVCDSLHFLRILCICSLQVSIQFSFLLVDDIIGRFALYISFLPGTARFGTHRLYRMCIYHLNTAYLSSKYRAPSFFPFLHSRSCHTESPISHIHVSLDFLHTNAPSTPFRPYVRSRAGSSGGAGYALTIVCLVPVV